MGVQSTIDWMWTDDFEPNFDTFKKRYPPGSDEYFRTKEAIGWFETLDTGCRRIAGIYCPRSCVGDGVAALRRSWRPISGRLPPPAARVLDHV